MYTKTRLIYFTKINLEAGGIEEYNALTGIEIK